MAVIKLKRSETAATTPTGLQYGEVAINITDKKIYIGNSSGATTLIVDGNAVGGGGGVSSFNTRTGAVTLTSSDVTTALGFTPISGVSTETIQDAAASLFTSGTHTGISVSYPDTNNAINLRNTGVLSFNTRTGAVSLTSGDVTTALGFTPTSYSAPTLGSTTLTSGTTITSVAGLTSVTSTSFTGSLTGNASTVTNGVYTTDTGTVTNTMLAGSIANNKLLNSSITVNGSSISLGGSATVTATATNALTLGTGLTGTSYNGSTAVTAAVDTAVIATKTYVDSVAQGLHQHSTVKTATTTTLASLTGTTVSYSGGAITWTGGNAATGASFNDGTTLTANNTESLADKILVKNEASGGGLGASKNGVYYVYAARELRRSSDGDQASDWVGGDFVFVTDGTLYDNTGWVQTNKVTTLDTDPIAFQQFSGAGSFTADETTLTLNGTQFSIKNTYSGQTSIVTLGTVTTGTWNATTIGATRGGTGLTSYATGDLVYANNTNTLTTLTKPASSTSLLQMTSAGTPSWLAMATGLATWLSTPSSANLFSLMTDDTGSGLLVFGTSPTFTTSVVAGSTSFDAFNTTATTLNIGGACSVGLNLAVAATGNRIVNIATGVTSGNRTINLANNKVGIRTVNLLSHNSFDQDFSLIGGGISARIADSIDTDSNFGDIYIGANATGAGFTDINYITIGTPGLSSTTILGSVNVLNDGGFYVGSSTDATRDGVLITPRSSGVSSYAVSITPASLTASRTFTLPNVNGTAITTGNLTSITTTGTIGTGTWQGTAIGAIYGGTAQTSYAAGDLLYASATNTLSKLTKPASTLFLQMNSSGVPSWNSPANTVDTTVDFGEYTNKLRIVITGPGVNYSITPQFFKNYKFSGGAEVATDAFTAYPVKDDEIVVENVYWNGTTWVAQLLLTLTNNLNSVQSIIDEVINTFTINIIDPIGLGESWTPTSIELAHTENTYVKKTVTGQTWVTANSFINCKIVGKTTTDHDAEDAVLDNINFDIHNIVPGTGFDIIAHAPNGTYGKYGIRCFGY